MQIDSLTTSFPPRVAHLNRQVDLTLFADNHHSDKQRREYNGLEHFADLTNWLYECGKVDVDELKKKFLNFFNLILCNGCERIFIFKFFDPQR